MQKEKPKTKFGIPKSIDICLACGGKVGEPDFDRATGHCKCTQCGQVFYVLGQSGSVGYFSGLGYCGNPRQHFDEKVS